MPATADIDEPQSADAFLGPEPGRAEDFLGPNPDVVKPLNADQPSIREVPGLGDGAAPVRVIPPQVFDQNQAPMGPLDVANEGFNLGMKGVGTAVAYQANMMPRLYNVAAPTLGLPKAELPFAAGKPVVTPEQLKTLEHFTPVGYAMQKLEEKSPVFKGVREAGRKAVSGFTTPENVALLPFAAAKPIQALFATQMAASTPEAVNRTISVLQDPDSSTEQKWEAMGDVGIHLAMVGSLALHMAPAEVKKNFTPEEVARQTAGGAEKPPVIPATVPESVAAAQPLELRGTISPTTTTTEVSDASKISPTAAVHGDVQPQPGEGAGQVSVEKSGAGVQPQAGGGIPGEAAPPGAPSAPVRAAEAVKPVPQERLEGARLGDAQMHIASKKTVAELRDLRNQWEESPDDPRQQHMLELIEARIKEVQSARPPPKAVEPPAEAEHPSLKTIRELKPGSGRAAIEAAANMDPSRPQDLEALKKMRAEADAARDAATAKARLITDPAERAKAMMNEVAPLSQRAADLREAVEAATGTGGSVDKIKVWKPDYKPPFPEKEVTPVETKKEEGKAVLKSVGPRIFPDEAAAAAKARLKEKLFSPKFGIQEELPAGLDPQSWKDLVTVAGNIVEGGAIKFADFVQEAVKQLGEGARPFLKQLYVDILQHPEAGSLKSKMTAPEEFGAEPGKVPAPPSPIGPVTFDPTQVPTVETPTADIKLSADVPNFKSGADPETGIVPGQELKGPYRRLGSAPIIVWRRLNGDLEVITGRHRLELAKRSGENTVPTQIVDEAKGYTKEMALTEDAEGNIRDNQGTVEDYAHYFKQRIDLTEEDARQRGLLRNAAGRSGFDIGRKASEDLQSLWKAGKIGDAQTLAIARAAPGNASAQQIGIKFAMEGKPADFVSNVVKAAMSESGGHEKNLDLFGSDDSAMQSMAAQANEAARAQKDLREQLSAISGAAKKPDVARKLGVDITDPAAVQAKAAQLKAEIARWENWPMHPDLVERTRGGREPLAKREPPKPTAAQVAAAPALKPGEKQGDLISSTQKEDLSLAGEKGTDAERIAAEKTKAEKDAADAKAKQDKEQQDLGPGMGAAIPSEFDQSGQTATGIKNATVDRERAQRGLPPAIEPLRRAFGAVWDAAMALIDRSPETQDALIDELRNKPRALTDTEDALLLHRQVGLQNEFGKATRDLAQAYEDGNDAMVVQNKLRVAELSDKLQDIYDIGKRAGTETGRGLNARKMMAAEDYTLAKMELDKRAANGGKPLTDQQREEITRLNQRIEATQKAYDEYVAKAQERVSQMQAQHAIDLLKREAAPVDPVVKRIVDRIGNVLKEQGDAAMGRLKGKVFSLSPDVLADLGIVGATKLFGGALEFGKWSAGMLADFGEAIRPHLADIFKSANAHFDGVIDQVGGKKKTQVRKQVRDMNPGERIARATEQVSEKVKAGKRDEVTAVVQRLARAFVEQGITERDALIDAVHGVLQGVDPEFTRRETMDAISGYGDFKPLSKDQVSVKLRDLKGQMQQVAKLEDMQAGQPPSKTGVQRRVPSAEESRLIKLVNDAKREFQIPVTDPESQLKSSLDELKKRLANRTAELEAKLAAGDFAPKPRRELKLDAEAQRLKAANERAKDEFRKGLVKDRLKNRTTYEKVGDALVKWRRAFLLSSPVTLAKLTSAAVQRMTITPIEEVVGLGVSKAFPEIARQAKREGGLSTKAESKALVEGFTKGMKDAWQVLKTGKSDLDLLYGKDLGYPDEMINFMGNLHGALKTVTKRNEFARSLQKRAEAAASAGIDTTDPMVQTRLAVDAYKDANRSIFMQDNRVVAAYKRMLSGLEQVDKTTGKVPLGGKILGTTSRVLLPIIKIPTNIVAETFEYSTGSVTGSVRLARALRKGVENVKPEEAELIMRNLKKGSLGAAVLALGFFSPNVVGGYYQAGEKRKKTDVKPGQVRVAGVDVPSYLLHNPLLETLQLGATIRRVADSKLRKKDTENQGIGAGMLAGGLGLTEEVPFVREMVEVSKAFNPHERGAFFGELGRSALVPQAAQWVAQHTDKDAQGNLIARKPKTAMERIEVGIPGLRQRVGKNPVQPQP